MNTQWYRTLPFRREGHIDYVVGIYDDATRESDGLAQVYGATGSGADACARLMQAAPALLEALERARNWMGAGGEWQDADASGRRVEVEQDINRQSSAALVAAKGD